MLVRETTDELFAVMIACSKIHTLDELNRLISTDLRRLLPHEMAAYGIGVTTERRAERCFNIDFSTDYIDRMRGRDRRLRPPLMRLWIDRRAPQFLAVDDLRSYASPQWLQTAHEHSVDNLACHGIADLASPFTTYFAFGRLRHLEAVDIKYLLHVLTPHLHAALLRALGAERADPEQSRGTMELAMQVADSTRRLSAREAEVLLWLHYGKTNSEISAILNTSAHTVKNHVQNILVKLGASNRTDAVSRALRLGLLR